MTGAPRGMRGTGVAGGPPLWRTTSLRADKWQSELGASEYLVRAIRYGIRDMPAVPFTDGLVLGEIPQSEEDRCFVPKDLLDRCQKGIYERVSSKEVEGIVQSGKMVSSAFVVWQGDEREKGAVYRQLPPAEQALGKGSVRMETTPLFAIDIQRGDTLMSWDIRSGYRHFSLHPDVRDYFVLRHAGHF